MAKYLDYTTRDGEPVLLDGYGGELPKGSDPVYISEPVNSLGEPMAVFPNVNIADYLRDIADEIEGEPNPATLVVEMGSAGLELKLTLPKVT